MTEVREKIDKVVPTLNYLCYKTEVSGHSRHRRLYRLRKRPRVSLC